MYYMIDVYVKPYGELAKSVGTFVELTESEAEEKLAEILQTIRSIGGLIEKEDGQMTYFYSSTLGDPTFAVSTYGSQNITMEELKSILQSSNDKVREGKG